MSIALTRMLQIRGNANADKYVIERQAYGAIIAFMDSTNEPDGIVTDEIKQIVIESNGNEVAYPVVYWDDDQVMLSEYRSPVIVDNENISEMIALNFQTFSWGFTIVPSHYMNNEVKLQKDYTVKFWKYANKFHNEVDTLAVAVLEANKTTYFKDNIGLDVTNDQVNFKYLQRHRLLSSLKTIQNANGYYGTQYFVGSYGMETLLNDLYKYGNGNVINDDRETLGFKFYTTANIPNEDGDLFTGYAFDAGSVGVLWRQERETYLNRTTPTHQWDIANMPVTNIPISTYWYYGVGDYSAMVGAATADNTRAYKEHYGFSVDVAFMTSFIPDTNTQGTPIVKFVMSNYGANDAIYVNNVGGSGGGVGVSGDINLAQIGGVAVPANGVLPVSSGASNNTPLNVNIQQVNGVDITDIPVHIEGANTEGVVINTKVAEVDSSIVIKGDVTGKVDAVLSGDSQTVPVTVQGGSLTANIGNGGLGIAGNPIATKEDV